MKRIEIAPVKLLVSGVGIIAFTIMPCTGYSNTALDSIKDMIKSKNTIPTQVTITPKATMSTTPRSSDGTAGHEIPFQSAINPGEYQFVLFYKSTCPHCVRFDPVLKEYSRETGISIKAFTTNGRSLPDLPQTKAIDQSTINKYFGTNGSLRVPTLFVMHKTTKHVFPVSTGEMQYFELKDRMNILMKKVAAYEK